MQAGNGRFENSIGKDRIDRGQVLELVKIADGYVGYGKAEHARKVMLAVVIDAKDFLTYDREGLGEIAAKRGLPYPALIIYE
jgi:hypothetical protein